MKKITSLLFILAVTSGFAQQQAYNLAMEPGTPSGLASNWYTFDNGAAAAEVITNPFPGGINPSATTKVLKCVMGPTNQFYAGVNNRFQDNAFGTWKIDAAVPNNLTVTIDVYKTYVGTVGIKMATTTGGATFEITNQNVGNTVVNQWQTLTWTIPNTIPATLETNISQFVVFVDWTQGLPDRQPGSTIYIDNIRFNAEKLTDPVTCTDGIQNGSETGVDCGGTACAPCPGQEPLVAAPTPPARNAADVVSIFSGAYSNVTLNELPTSWSSIGSFTVPSIVGNPTWKFTGLDFMGMVTNYTTGVNLSTMENMHIDYWTPSTNGIEIKIVNTTPPGVQEAVTSLGATVTGSWQSKDIPMSAFAALADKTEITQLLIDATGAGTSTLFIDNFYFYKGLPLGINDFVKSTLKIFPNPANEIINLSSDTTIGDITLYNTLGQIVSRQPSSSNEVSVNVSGLSNGVYILTAKVGNELVRKQFIKQ